jgi:hypothetical protein
MLGLGLKLLIVISYLQVLGGLDRGIFRYQIRPRSRRDFESATNLLAAEGSVGWGRKVPNIMKTQDLLGSGVRMSRI